MIGKKRKVKEKMKRLCKLVALIFALIFSFNFGACASAGGSIDMHYFNTNVHLETHGTPLDRATVFAVKSMFDRLQDEFDSKLEQSLIAKFNASNAGQSFSLSSDAVKVLSLAKHSYDFSGGLFDPTVFPLVKLWQFAPDYPVINFAVPSEEDINSARQAVNFESVFFDDINGTLTKTSSNTELDFGGILKGYAADEAAKIVQEFGHNAGYINVGGSSLNLFNVSSLSIRHPRANAEIPNILSINTGEMPFASVSTSGDYEKYYIAQNVLYPHLINPKTGYPSNTGVASVTVIGTGFNGAFLDAITTAACLKEHVFNDGESDLVAFLEKIEAEVDGAMIFAIFCSGDQKEIITNQKKDENFTLFDNDYSILNF